MEAPIELYTTICLDADMDKTALVQAVAEIAGGLAAGPTVVTELAEIFVAENGEFAEAGGTGAEDGCRHFRYCLEIEPLESVDVLACKRMIASLLAELREAGFKADLPGDSEAELPSE
jgi:hypothetical protein